MFKKARACPLFLASIAGLVLQNIGIFVIADAIAILGDTALFMLGFVAIIAAGLLLLAKKTITQAWIVYAHYCAVLPAIKMLCKHVECFL